MLSTCYLVYYGDYKMAGHRENGSVKDKKVQPLPVKKEVKVEKQKPKKKGFFKKNKSE